MWRIRRLLALTQLRAAAPLLIAAVLLLALGVLLDHEANNHIDALEAWITKLGPWGVVAFVGMFALGTSLLVPEALFGIAAGALFGLTGGVFAALAGSGLAAAVQYALARWLLRAHIQRMLAARPLLAAIQRAVTAQDMRLQLLLRLTPLNPATISYLLGAAGVRFPPFLVACLALTPHIFIEVYIGHAGKHVLRMADGGSPSTHLQVVVLVGGLAVALIAIAIASRAAFKAVLRSVAQDDSDGSGPGTA